LPPPLGLTSSFSSHLSASTPPPPHHPWPKFGTQCNKSMSRLPHCSTDIVLLFLSLIQLEHRLLFSPQKLGFLSGFWFNNGECLPLTNSESLFEVLSLSHPIFNTTFWWRGTWDIDRSIVDSASPTARFSNSWASVCLPIWASATAVVDQKSPNHSRHRAFTIGIPVPGSDPPALAISSGRAASASSTEHYPVLKPGLVPALAPTTRTAATAASGHAGKDPPASRLWSRPCFGESLPRASGR